MKLTKIERNIFKKTMDMFSDDFTFRENDECIVVVNTDDADFEDDYIEIDKKFEDWVGSWCSDIANDYYQFEDDEPLTKKEYKYLVSNFPQYFDCDFIRDILGTKKEND